MQKISRMVALLNGQDLTPRNPLEKAVKTLVASIGKGGGGSASNTPLEVEATLASDLQTGKMIITLNKTAGELYEASCAGKLMKLSMQIQMHDDESGVDYVIDVTKILPFSATRMVAESIGAVVYNFDARIGDSDDGDKLLCSADIDENDTVVLTEVLLAVPDAAEQPQG